MKNSIVISTAFLIAVAVILVGYAGVQQIFPTDFWIGLIILLIGVMIHLAVRLWKHAQFLKHSSSRDL